MESDYWFPKTLMMKFFLADPVLMKMIRLIGIGGSEENSPRMLRINLETVNPETTPSAKGVIMRKMLDDVVLGGKIVRKNNKDDLFVFLLTENGWIKMVSLEESPRGKDEVRNVCKLGKLHEKAVI